MAIFELRTYSVVVGKMADVVDLYQREGWPALEKHPKKLLRTKSRHNRNSTVVSMSLRRRHR